MATDMVDLSTALDSHELIVLRIIGEWLELDLTGKKHRECIKAIAPQLSQLDMQLEMSYLPIEEAEALKELLSAGGRIPVASFERQFGSIRQMGPGKLEREEPWLDPVSPAEALWYRGFLFRGFLEAEEGQLVEFYYLPREYLSQFPEDSKSQTGGPSEGLQPVKPSHFESKKVVEGPVDSVDDVTGLLCHSQLYPIREENIDSLRRWLLNGEPDRLSLLFHLCWDLKLFRATDEGARPAREAVRWLKLNREEQLRELAVGWVGCSWNELHHTPGLIIEGSGWSNDPLLARSALVGVLPKDAKWLGISNFINHMKQSDPDFQRPDGRYDDWYIRDQRSGDFLTGFENWNRVEGQLIRFLICGPLHWLGMVDLYLQHEDQELLFRLSERGVDWLNEKPPEKQDISIPIVVNNDGSIIVSNNSNRYHRFQVARICRSQPPAAGKPFEYQLVPSTLSLGREQGIEPSRMIEFLETASEREIPPGTKRAILRWSERGVEGRLENAVILRVREAEILEKLRANQKTRPFISEALGDLAATVQPDDWPKLRQAAAQIGLLLDDSIEED